jgi:DNA modification methylase
LPESANYLVFQYTFLGSGTTLVACAKLGIEAVGIDISEEYCSIAEKRLTY